MNDYVVKPSVPDDILRRQAWKYYVLLLAWPVYLFFLPWVWTQSSILGFILMIFPGIYLFTGLGFLMHESWHRYVPNIPNDFFYLVFSWLLLTDPQIYRLLHGLHHLEVNSWKDLEFHPFGQIRSRWLCILLNLSELLLGMAALVVVQTFAMMANPRFRGQYRASSLLTSVFMWTAYLALLGWAAQSAFAIPLRGVVVPYALTFWFGSLVVHHSQLIEHGNLIVAGDWDVRNKKTRNLAPLSWPDKAFLFFTHNDSREHVLHHTLPAVHSRLVPGRIPLPEGAVMITLREYPGIVLDMITGRSIE